MLPRDPKDTSAARAQVGGRAPDFQTLFESAPGLYLVLKPDLTIVAVSEAYLRATMTERAKILGRGIFEVFPDNPDEPEATGVQNLRASLSRVLDRQTPDTMAVQKYDIRRPESEGGGFEERHWSPVNSPVLGADGEVAYIIHRVEDVTEFVRLKNQGSEQVRLTEELKTRAERMEAEIFRRAQEIQDANRMLREFQGELEERVLARTGELRRANEELKREIQERERTEEALHQSEGQLRQSQKLEAVGRLAGGIAHDFNNLLTVILSYSDIILRTGAPAGPIRNGLEEIKAAGERAASLTHQLLAFSRQQVLEPKVLDVNEVLTTLSQMLKRLLGEDIELRLSLAPVLDRVMADRGQLDQVVMNLVVNARDAMPHGGRLNIETANVTLDESVGETHFDVRPGSYVMLAVSDTGVGMDAATKARVFEPFFTTKERGKGTGLGLSTVFGIVKQSGGNIYFYSEPEVGTTFKVYFPRADGKLASPEEPSAGARGARGTETILLVEDEEQVREVAGTILRAAGFHVLVAATPAEAILLCEKSPEHVDLVLTDVIMPKMNGRQVAERVRELRPGVRVLFMSGYTDDMILSNGILELGASFIQKPMTPDSLTRKVREVLDRPVESRLS